MDNTIHEPLYISLIIVLGWSSKEHVKIQS